MGTRVGDCDRPHQPIEVSRLLTLLRGTSVPAILVGGAFAFVTGERLVEAIRPALLLDPDPRWLVPRLVLWIGLLSATAAAGALGAALFQVWTRSRFSPGEPAPLPFRAATLALIAAGALAAGAIFRFAWLDTLPCPLWVDDVSLIEPTLALEGSWRDFADSIRPVPYLTRGSYGSVGVLYLEFFRMCLAVAGTTVFGVRLPSAIAGTLSVATAILLGRALLPRGGGALAGLALAGLRWSLILSRWGWVAILLAPILDVAALFLIEGRRRRSLALAACAGFVAGLGAHVYLAAWIGGAALVLFALWPFGEERGTRRIAMGASFLLAFALAAAPLFLLARGRASPYFARASDHNVTLEIWWLKSALPPFGAAADALAAPWLLPDPTARHDIPGRRRLGWTVGVLLLVAFAHAMLRPRSMFSGYLLAHALAAFAATVVGGRAGLPNGFRFGYLTSASAVACAGGALAVLAMFPAGKRRPAAIVITGLVAIGSVAGARDLLKWADSRATFDGFWGQDTLIARAAARWDAYGAVELDPALGKNPLTIRGVRRYRLDPSPNAFDSSPAAKRGPLRKFHVIAPSEASRPGERLLERVTDAWGREWGRVYGRSTGRIPTRAGG